MTSTLILPALNLLFSNCSLSSPSLISLNSESEGDPPMLKGLIASPAESFLLKPSESSEQVLVLKMRKNKEDLLRK